ncbi:hypothetical protein NLJ89_g7190 [Agrocybe chaxingu]|uniref:Uncharacterized protein n=1 Tax=Agrocybe chaxingu TaxID=84603 RepID=A0A9W8JV04_9AGAR|nr:hypothetical protein NLJ89_g7190 [Agrocybe chaxingu]
MMLQAMVATTTEGPLKGMAKTRDTVMAITTVADTTGNTTGLIGKNTTKRNLTRPLKQPHSPAIKRMAGVVTNVDTVVTIATIHHIVGAAIIQRKMQVAEGARRLTVLLALGTILQQVVRPRDMRIVIVPGTEVGTAPTHTPVPSRHGSRSRDEKRKRKHRDRSGSRERDKKRRKRRDKEKAKEKGEEKRSILTGKKIKLKVKKDKGDHERDANRKDLLQFLNSAYE